MQSSVPGWQAGVHDYPAVLVNRVVLVMVADIKKHPVIASLWAQLADQAGHFVDFDLSATLRRQPQRFAALTCSYGNILRADVSKQMLDRNVLQLLWELAEACDLAGWRQKLFQGGVVNTTEQRSVDHVVWRQQVVAATRSGADTDHSVQSMLQCAEAIRDDAAVDDVVHIGIGGSGLGPELALQALVPWQNCRQKIRIVANLDGHDLQQTLDGLNPQRTRFIVVSKSWSTLETLCNACSAMAWLQQAGIADCYSRMVAVTAKPDLARQWSAQQVLTMPEGMGGRFSIWSAVSLPLAIAWGRAVFLDFVRGGAELDQHFAQQPLSKNLPVWLGLLDVWNASFMHFAARCVVPYHHGLRRLPAYLQQLEMESNGKRVNRAGEALSWHTAGITWGEEGSNSQHAFFQWLHQGTQRIPVEFLLVKEPNHTLTGHHTALLANGLAQAQALMQGSSAATGQLPGHQDFPGNRPSTTLVLDALTPSTFGVLLALYEHRVFVAGVIWGINSFDQWGVELGKQLAKDLEPRLRSGDLSGLDASTAGLISWLRPEC